LKTPHPNPLPEGEGIESNNQAPLPPGEEGAHSALQNGKVRGKTIQIARKLRREQTDAEKLLWSRLRNSQLENFKFRRQHLIAPYIADFFCEQRNLIIELDGGQHTPETDAARTSYLESNGFKILRFWNNDVLTNIQGVLTEILNTLKPPHPHPSPGGRGALETSLPVREGVKEEAA
jgi:very-short-patch-repair endonuclease